MANLILPGAAYTEKDATYVNTEGRAQRVGDFDLFWDDFTKEGEVVQFMRIFFSSVN